MELPQEYWMNSASRLNVQDSSKSLWKRRQQVIEFYKGYGFRITHYQDGPFGGEVYLSIAPRG